MDELISEFEIGIRGLDECGVAGGDLGSLDSSLFTLPTRAFVPFLSSETASLSFKYFRTVGLGLSEAHEHKQ